MGPATCGLSRRRTSPQPFNHRCSPIQYARSWPSNFTVRDAPMAASLLIATHDRVLVQFRAAFKTWDRFFLSAHTWLVVQVDSSAARFTAADFAGALGLSSRGFCRLPHSLASSGRYEVWRTSKKNSVLMLDQPVALWPPFGKKSACARAIPDGEYILGTKAYARALTDVEALDYFDYWIKADADISFHRHAPLLETMAHNGAHFAHTAVKRDSRSATLHNCTNAYLRAACANTPGSPAPHAMPREDFSYFSNLVGGWLGLWQSPQMIQYLQHWWNWPTGWRAGSTRWTDQQFWPNALWLAGAFEQQNNIRSSAVVLDLEAWRGEGGVKGAHGAETRFFHKPYGMVGARTGQHGPLLGGFTLLGQNCSAPATSCRLFRSAHGRVPPGAQN